MSSIAWIVETTIRSKRRAKKLKAKLPKETKELLVYSSGTPKKDELEPLIDKLEYKTGHIHEHTKLDDAPRVIVFPAGTFEDEWMF